ncbi:MAG: DUF1844 domain-containing protein [Candidatus Omnitrophica bacterium]|nr:DUF1844 domain-containing protein [Candidatus Omnitrophota bacterium]
MEEIHKKVDESWKDQSKQKDADQTKESFAPPEADFNFFVTTLAIQASISLGMTPNPANNQTEKNLPQAKFIIDTLGMLQEKTKGNLTTEENTMLENILYELRTQYVELSKGAKP